MFKFQSFRLGCRGQGVESLIFEKLNLKAEVLVAVVFVVVLVVLQIDISLP